MSTLQDRLAGLPEAPEPSTELATISAIQQIVPAEFFKAGGSEDILTKLETEVRARAAKLDISTDFGRKEIASLAYKVARSKTALDKSGKDLTEDIRKQKEAIDAERRKVTERLDSLKEEVRKPLTDWEDAEKARVGNHEAALKLIAETGALDRPLNLEEIEGKLSLVRQLYGNRDWEEFAVRAKGTAALAIEGLEAGIVRAKEAIAQREELERQRKEAEEKAIREREQAAAEAATKAAERKAQEALEAAQRAAQAEQQRLENERHEAEARAKQAEARRVAEVEASAERERQAERQRLEDLRQAELRREREAAEAKREQERAVQAEKDRQAAIARAKETQEWIERKAEERRTANKKHRAKIENEILDALEEVGVPPAMMLQLLRAIKEGRIPHVSIAY